MSISKPLEEESRIAIKRICGRMLAGEVTFIEGTREILVTATNSRLDKNDPDPAVFIGIESETDEVPSAEQLKYWNKVAEEEKAAEWAELESWAKSYGLTACKNFISRL